MKKVKIIPIIIFISGFLCGLTYLTYANSYNSEEISYDTSTSGAVQTNVKDALDFLYNKTKSGAASECPENMSCVEKPGVTMIVNGSGTVNKGTVYVGLNESNTFTVTPTDGNVLTSISCDNGYILSSYKTNQNSSSKSECEISQEITITNPGVTTGATCNIYFGSYDITIQSIGWSEVGTSGQPDPCNSASVNCACYYIKNGGSNFSYNGHTGCNFKSTTCKFTSYHGFTSFNCTNLIWDYGYWRGHKDTETAYFSASCSGVITCKT